MNERWDIRNAPRLRGARWTHRVGVYEAGKEEFATAKLNELGIYCAMRRERELQVVGLHVVQAPGDVAVRRDTNKRAGQRGICGER